MIDPADPSSKPSTLPPAWVVVLAGFAICLALCWPMVTRIWASGDFLDTDDAMRMVQVRDWIAGQSWFDLTAYRLDPPSGSPMHWSRVVDMPVAVLVKAASLIAPPQTAERLARIAYPLLLQLTLLGLLAWVGRLLGGARGSLCAVILGVLTGFMFGQFVPGRVDHHSLQIVLLLTIVGTLLGALDPRRPDMAVAAAGAMALSLSISLENLPMIAVASTILPVAWLLRGPEAAIALRRFGLGLMFALPLCYGLFHGQVGRWEAACDAYSTAHLLPGMTGAAACLALSVLSAEGWQGRTLGLLSAGLAVAAGASLFATCYSDPFTGLDPLVRLLWLGNTTEARTLKEVLGVHPDVWPMLIVPPALGIGGMVAGALCTTGLQRARWIALLPVTGAAALAACWIIRADTSLAPLASLGSVFTLCWLWRRAHGALVLGAALPLSATGWALAMPAGGNAAEADRLAQAAICREASNYPPLAALPEGLVFAPMDAGAHLLAHTRHSVLAAPYHRNNRGNRLVLDAFLAKPDLAEHLVRNSGARWLMICPGEVQMAVTAARAPEGLSARLLAGDIPDWLQAEAVENSKFKVFRLR